MWALLLSEGRGGFNDYGKYRKILTEMIWEGKEPELTPEQQAEAAKQQLGQPTPTGALDEARSLFESIKAKQAEPPGEGHAE